MNRRNFLKLSGISAAALFTAASEKAEAKVSPPSLAQIEAMSPGILKSGTAKAVFFGFSTCPMTCDPAMRMLKTAIDHSKATPNDLQIIFVSVWPYNDKEGDTQQKIEEMFARNKIAAFANGIATNKNNSDATAQLKKAERDFFVFANQETDNHAQHRAFVYFFDEKNTFQKPAVLSKAGPERSQEQIIAELTKAINQVKPTRNPDPEPTF